MPGDCGGSARFCCSVGVFQRDDGRGRRADGWIGSGESGKSTIVKQMKIIHQNGYTVEELAMYRLTIYKNLVDCAKALVSALRQFDITPEDPTNVVCLDARYVCKAQS